MSSITRTIRTHLPLAIIILLITATIPPAHAQSTVKVTALQDQAGPAIAADFTGLSFEMQNVLADTNGHHFFSPDNRRLIATFKALDIKNLRVGGNTADRPALPTPNESDVDSLFAFARAADVKVIYTLRLNAGDIDAATRMANYISRHYSSQLSAFAIGNEPNVFSKQFASYLAEWKKYAAQITAPTNSPGAIFCGPSTSPGHESWSASFASEFGNRGPLAFISQHDYPGGDARKATNAPAARDKILSPAIDEHYAKFFAHFVPAIISDGLPYRLEEANSFYDGGAFDVSDTFASALWALDYEWWWAAHHASGINFHTGDKVAARDENKPCRYAVFWTAPDGYNVHPVGYALKMFSLGAQGQLVSTKIENPDNQNVVVYAAAPKSKTICFTLINREHGRKPAEFALATGFSKSSAQVMFLTAPGNDVAMKTGITLGGAGIADDGAWEGKWTPLPGPAPDGNYLLKLPPANAALVSVITQ